MPVAQNTLEYWLERIQNETYDTAVMVNVLEHIETTSPPSADYLAHLNRAEEFISFRSRLAFSL